MLRLKKFLRVLEVKPWVVGLFLGVVYFVLYWLTASRVNVSYADSDLLTTIGYQLGVAHPPGYPLYIFLVYVFTHLPIWGSVAFKAHLLSMLLHSVSLVVVFLACVDLSSLVFEKTSKLTKIWVATLATAGLGSSALFWLYSSVAEKYPLNDLFIALIFLATVKIFSGQKEKLWLMVLAVVGGLALNHHHTIFLFLPAVFLSLVLFRKLIFKNLFWTTLVFVVSLVVPVIMLLGFNSRKTAISWRFEPNAKGLYRMISRRDLSGYMVLTGEYRGIYLDGLTVDDVLAKTPEVLGNYVDHFGVVYLAVFGLGVVGLMKMMKTKRAVSGWLLLVVMFTTVFIPLYVEWPSDLSTQGLRIRMYLAGYMVMPLVFNLAVVGMMQRVNRLVGVLVMVCLSMVVATKTVVSFQENNLRNFDFVSRLYTQILEKAPENALLACSGDISCFALIYAQQIEEKRPDVLILPHGKQIVGNQDLEEKLERFEYENNPEKFWHLLTNNIGKRPVYLVELQELYFELLGIDKGLFFYNPVSYAGVLSSEPSEATVQEYGLSYELLETPIPKYDHHRQQLRAMLAQKHLLNARALTLMGREAEGIDMELNLAEKLNQPLPDSYKQAVVNTRAELASSVFEVEVIDLETMKKMAVNIEDSNPKEAYVYYMNALARDPEDLLLRSKLVIFLQSQAREAEAKVEMKNVLQLEPEFSFDGGKIE